MLGIDRYILRQLAVGMVAVTIGLTAILWLTQSLRFIEITVNKGTSVLTFLHLTVLILPSFLIVILPVSLFAVVLFTYNKLINDREIVVLRAAGLSHWSLARPALTLGLLAAALSLVLNLWVIPKSAEQFQRMQWRLRNNATSALLQEGIFSQVSSGLTVYVRAINTGGEMLDIIVHDRRNPLRTVTILAQKGVMIRNDNAPPKILLFNGTRQQITRGSDRLSLLYFDNYAMEFSDSPEPAGERSRDARERSIGELFSVEPSQVSPIEYRQFRVEGHQRLASPLYHIAFALMASACLLAGWFNRRGQASRLLLAIALMLAIQSLALGSSNLAARDLMLIPLLYAVPLVPIVIGTLVLLGPELRRGRRTGMADGPG